MVESIKTTRHRLRLSPSSMCFDSGPFFKEIRSRKIRSPTLACRLSKAYSALRRAVACLPDFADR